MKDETGNKYGRLTVLKRVENNKHGTTRWLCKCDCGKEIITNGQSLRNGQTKSCGCIIAGKKRSGDTVYLKLLRLTKWQSKKNNIPFELTLDEIKKIVHQNCSYCGRKPYIERKAYHRTRYTKGPDTDEIILINGIDKIDPSKGYTLSNSVSCCKYCNRAKSDLTIAQFKELIKLIYNKICQN